MYVPLWKHVLAGTNPLRSAGGAVPGAGGWSRIGDIISKKDFLAVPVSRGKAPNSLEVFLSGCALHAVRATLRAP